MKKYLRTTALFVVAMSMVFSMNAFANASSGYDGTEDEIIAAANSYQLVSEDIDEQVAVNPKTRIIGGNLAADGVWETLHRKMSTSGSNKLQVSYQNKAATRSKVVLYCSTSGVRGEGNGTALLAFEVPAGQTVSKTYTLKNPDNKAKMYFYARISPVTVSGTGAVATRVAGYISVIQP